ncbi:MAG: X2-like carbohydrate binding domain-containing protein, partial [Eubacteriales bacterium]|nr:X2-like carbohydrate binding domain-containing protein [Eubacteriales bacterium]
KILTSLLFLLLILCIAPTAAMASGYACEMDGLQYGTLTEALAMVGSGESKTIKILNNIDYDGGIITNDGRSVTFDLNGFTVNINNTAVDGTGLRVEGYSTIDIAGAGSLNVSGTTFGVSVRGSAAVVSSATSPLYACSALGTGSSITVVGNAVSTGANSTGVLSGDRAAIVIGGDVLSKHNGVSALKSACITVNGNVVAETGNGVYSDESSSVIIRGHINASGIGVNGAYNETIIVDGIITAPVVIVVEGQVKALDDYDGIGTGDLADYLIFSGIGTRVYLKNHPEATPTSVAFDKNGGTDIVLAIKPYSATLLDIYNGTTALSAGTDYILSNDSLALSAEYLFGQPLGEYDLELDFSNGVDPFISLNIINTTVVTGMPSANVIVVGENLTFKPLPTGGTWQWDSEYFTGSFSGSAVFTALKKGLSTITYSVNGISTSSVVTISEVLALAILPSEGEITTGGQITVTPNIAGGTWTYDHTVLSRVGNVFTGLTAGRTIVSYTIGGQTASAGFSVLAKPAVTPPATEAPAPPTVAGKTAASVTLTTIPGADYRNGEGQWQASPEFTGLEPDTVYTFYVRLAETPVALASLASEGLTVRTDHLPDNPEIPVTGEPYDERPFGLVIGWLLLAAAAAICCFAWVLGERVKKPQLKSH